MITPFRIWPGVARQAGAGVDAAGVEGTGGRGVGGAETGVSVGLLTGDAAAGVGPLNGRQAESAARSASATAQRGMNPVVRYAIGLNPKSRLTEYAIVY